MKKGSINFFELHVEKFVLGACGLFALAFMWMYLINSPNRVEYNGQLVGPGDLDEAMVQHAASLESAVRNAKAEPVTIPEYSRLLVSSHAAGILGKPEAGPAVAATLPPAVPFGTPITIPGAAEEQVADIEVVTPLRPETPAVRTGLSMAVRRQVNLAATEAADEPPTTAEEKPVETPWVSVAAWFDIQAQTSEMTARNYEPYRASVLFCGLDVQRQEQQADGEWSEWKDVTGSKATPKLDVPEPIFDPDSGVIVNSAEIAEAYRQVQAMQAALAQPEFYTVEGGDEWAPPPLEGLEVEEESEETEENEPVVERERPAPEERENRGGRQPPPPPPSPRTGGGNRGGGVSLSGAGRTGGGGGGAVTGAASEARQRAENARAAQKALTDAKKAYSKKNYDEAARLANEAVNNTDAKANTKRAAEKLLKQIEKARSAADESGGGAAISMPGIRSPISSGRTPGGSGRTPGGAPAPEQSHAALNLVSHPQNDQKVALWFHDDSVESGKTYRYRMRARLWNRYVGQLRAVKNVEDAKKTLLAGEWSLPTSAVTVAPNTHVFVKGARTTKQAASVDVWKWLQGRWVRESFEVGVGDTIGGVKRIKTGETDEDGKDVKEDVDFGTGAVVLDLRFDERVKIRAAAGRKGEFTYREVTSLVLVYLDPADGQVKERVQALDRDDPLRKKLEEEYES